MIIWFVSLRPSNKPHVFLITQSAMISGEKVMWKRATEIWPRNRRIKCSASEIKARTPRNWWTKVHRKHYVSDCFVAWHQQGHGINRESEEEKKRELNYAKPLLRESECYEAIEWTYHASSIEICYSLPWYTYHLFYELMWTEFFTMYNFDVFVANEPSTQSDSKS